MRNTRNFWTRGLVFCGERKPDQNSCETENHRIHDLSAKTTGFYLSSGILRPCEPFLRLSAVYRSRTQGRKNRCKGSTPTYVNTAAATPTPKVLINRCRRKCSTFIADSRALSRPLIAPDPAFKV